MLRNTYYKLREELEHLRASRGDQVPQPKPPKAEPTKLASEKHLPPENKERDFVLPWWWRLLSRSWRVQMAFTLLLWATLLNVGFGAVFFVCACLYWLYAWGTEAQRRNLRPNTILAGWYYDNARII
ncbi:expressed conserved protein [Echinococcus multilocularis]|uniref:Expressed conserved protein n=1 Tax=Echinococcus multilocularis TaxID=6211 RepID=A0A087VYZ3_ECHMU|nr:expressed conserved protein [Echinococcus multilocularis]